VKFVIGHSEWTYDIKNVPKQKLKKVQKGNLSSLQEITPYIQRTIEESETDENNSPTFFDDKAKLQRNIIQAHNLFTISNITRGFGTVNDPLCVQSGLKNLLHASHHTATSPLLEFQKNSPLPFHQRPILLSHPNRPMITSSPNYQRVCCPIQIDFGNSETNCSLSRQSFLNSLILARIMKEKCIFDTFVTLTK
jgi:hypothetical protein